MSSHKYSFVVYSKADCPQCVMTKKWLEDRGLEYQEEDALEHVEMIRAQDVGMQAPAVAFVVDSKQVLFWTGFRPALMKELVSSALGGEVA